MAASTRLVAILAMVAAGAGCRPLSQHPLAVEAVREVGRNARVTNVLGQPVECGTTVRGHANDANGIAALTFDVKGPKGSGVVAVEGKKTRGAWGVTLLELRPAGGGAPVSLTGDVETDTPKFDPAATRTDAAPAAPPGDVEIVLPPGGPGG